MVKIINPIPELNGESISSFSNWIESTNKGLITFLSNSSSKEDPILSVGGPNKERTSTADSEMVGTIEARSYKEGMQTNPLQTLPASFFMPMPNWIFSKLPGPLGVVNNPELIITIIAVASMSKEENTYSFNRETLPTKVIDNEEMENMLFN